MENGRQRQCPILQTTLYGVPVYKSLTKDSGTYIEEQREKGREESKIKKGKAPPKKPRDETGLPAGLQKKVDAVKQKLDDLYTALELLSKAAKSTELAPLLTPAIVAEIDGAFATTAEANAALDLLLGTELAEHAPNAAELAEQGIKEAEEVVAEVTRKKKIITQLVDNAKTLAGVDTPSEPP